MSALTNHILSALPEDLATAVTNSGKLTVRHQGDVLLAAGEPIEQVWFPLTGMAAVFAGAQQEDHVVCAAVVGREGAVGLQRALGPSVSPASAVAQIPGDFLSVPGAALQNLAEADPALRAAIARYLDEAWAAALKGMACNVHHDASHRLCRMLLRCFNCAESESVPLNQAFFGRALGVRRTTVTVLAQELQASGIIKYTRGQIALLDRPALEQRACPC